MYPYISTSPRALRSLSISIGSTIEFIMIAMTYTRILWLVTPDSKRNISTLWLPIHVTTFLPSVIQIGGDVMKGIGQQMAVHDPNTKIVSIGLLLMLWTYLFFTATALHFWFISKNWSAGEFAGRRWRKMLGGVVISSFLFCVRLPPSSQHLPFHLGRISY